MTNIYNFNRFENEVKLENIKIFKLTDEPNAAAISEDEYEKIQKEIMNNPNYKFIEDMRLREVNMEKENNKKVKIIY